MRSGSCASTWTGGDACGLRGRSAASRRSPGPGAALRAGRPSREGGVSLEAGDRVSYLSMLPGVGTGGGRAAAPAACVGGMVRIAEIAPGSIAEALELQIGSRIVRINGELVRDGIDFRFLEAEPVLEVEVQP